MACLSESGRRAARRRSHVEKGFVTDIVARHESGHRQDRGLPVWPAADGGCRAGAAGRPHGARRTRSSTTSSPVRSSTRPVVHPPQPSEGMTQMSAPAKTKQRSFPKIEFTDSEAGALEFPSSKSRKLQLLQAGEAACDDVRGRHRRRAARSGSASDPGLDLRLRRRARGLSAGVDGREARPTGTRSSTPTRNGSSRSIATTAQWCVRSSCVCRTPSGRAPTTAGTRPG